MSRTCVTCRHPERDLIEADLFRGGVALRDIADKYRVGRSSLHRHRQEHMVVDDDGVVYKLSDILDVPLRMRERSELIDALLKRALEPLQRSGRQSGLAHTQTGFIIRLLRLQQQDEQTILKVTGLLREDGGHTPDNSPSNVIMSEEYKSISQKIDQAIENLSEGDCEKAARIRNALADRLHASLGIVEDEMAEDHESTNDSPSK